jgi:hypothetical protein
VKRVRGKNILWLSLIAVLLSAMMVTVGTGKVGNTKLYIDPERLPTQAGTIGHPGDIYDVAVKVDNVENLWAAGFTIKIAPFVRTLVASNFAEGPFLSAGGTWPTYFNAVPNAFEGEIQVAITRFGKPGEPPTGVSGDGVLMTFKLSVIEAGDSPVDILDSVLIDPDLNPMDHNVFNGAYHGATADLIRANMPDGRRPKVGDIISFNTKVVNKADVPLCVRARYEFERVEDGRRIRIYAGQNYGGGGLGEPLPFEYLYVDGYYAWIEGGWTNPGSSLIGEPDGNFAESTTACTMTSMYTFEDITLAGREIANVDLHGYTRQPDGTANDFDPYLFFDGYGWVWCDSMGGSSDWAWTGGRYYAGGPYDMPEYYVDGAIHTEAAINAAEILIHNYGASGPRMQIDAMRWKVEFSPITPVVPPVFCLGPYGSETQELELDPVTWPATSDHIGTYAVTVYVEYSALYDSLGFHWKNMGDKVATFTFEIKE